MTAAARRQRHQLVMLPLTLGLTVVFLLARPAEGVQIAFLVVAVAAVGVPHGALDDLVAASVLPEALRPFPVFAALYLVIAAAVVGAWILAPVPSLVAFLLLSVVHFGLGDSPPAIDGPVRRSISVVARGGIAVVVPILFHPGPVAEVFSMLVARPVAVPDVYAAARLAAVPVVAALSVEIVRVVLDGHPGRVRTVEIGELAVLLLLFMLVPPLLAFGVYFGGWHSIRHLLDLVDAREGRGGSPIRALAHDAWPLTAATLVGGAAAYAALVASGRATDAAVLTSLFVGLSALTVPHMLLNLFHRES